MIAGLVICPIFAWALEQFAPTPAEVRMLPPFCADRLEKGSGGKNVASAAQLGKGNYLHIHHYCFAVNFVNRARQARDPKDRSYNLGLAKNNYKYVIKGTEPRFWMRPQIYVELGKVHLQLKEAGEASRLFNDAIAFNPEYEPAYLALIDMHKESGLGKEALDVATAGLGYVPGSQSLKKAYLALGGKEPFPEPARKAESLPSDTLPPAPAPQDAGTPGGTALVPTAEGTSATSTIAEPGGSPIPETGCRFCPPEDIQRKWRESFNGAKDQPAK
ncbi:tetratricopeptide repeat protein [Aromatoleum diolicum]|uniref:Tetratricopeptide repeat protein n=1 Tax=Aromatoleum diolicum TaxID=75796 RepID=A0ABX1QG59_9RHOO|nr:hypothetical protein [Aromatoleum diolicum]NMG76000.1 hypothetical protein [Aromatoleum diolicum]